MLPKTPRKRTAIRSMGKAVAMQALALPATLLLAGCSEKEAACERAVKTALKDPDSYRTVKIKKLALEGKAFDNYDVFFSYRMDRNVNGKAFCLYHNDNREAIVNITNLSIEDD